MVNKNLVLPDSERVKDYFLDLCQYRKNVFSKTGEDGVLEHLLFLLGINKGWCCEFGAWDGKRYSNTFNLIKNRGWKGVMIEADPEKFEALQKTQSEFPKNIIAIHEVVHYLPGKGRTLEDILSQTPIPLDFDVLSIDVDGPDYHIWKNFTGYRPKIVIIECSPLKGYIIQREGAIHKKENDGSTSFLPMRELGEKKGYELLVRTHNLIFLDKSLIKLLD